MQRQFQRTLVALGVLVGQARVFRVDRAAVHQTIAHPVVGLHLEAVAHAAAEQRDVQVMGGGTGGHAAFQGDTGALLAALFVFAAEVVHVEAAVAAVAVIAVLGTAAKGVGQPVLGGQALVGELG